MISINTRRLCLENLVSMWSANFVCVLVIFASIHLNYAEEKSGNQTDIQNPLSCLTTNSEDSKSENPKIYSRDNSCNRLTKEKSEESGQNPDFNSQQIVVKEAFQDDDQIKKNSSAMLARSVYKNIFNSLVAIWFGSRIDKQSEERQRWKPPKVSLDEFLSHGVFKIHRNDFSLKNKDPENNHSRKHKKRRNIYWYLNEHSKEGVIPYTLRPKKSRNKIKQHKRWNNQLESKSNEIFNGIVSLGKHNFISSKNKAEIAENTFTSPQRIAKNALNEIIHNNILYYNWLLNRRSVLMRKQNLSRNAFWAKKPKTNTKKIPTIRMKKLWFARDRGRTPISRFLRTKRSNPQRVKLSAPNTELSDKIEPAVRLKRIWLVQNYKKLMLPNRVLKESAENVSASIGRKSFNQIHKKRKIRSTWFAKENKNGEKMSVHTRILGINQMKPLHKDLNRRINRARIPNNAKISPDARIHHTWFVKGKKGKSAELTRGLFKDIQKKPPDSRAKQKRRLMASTTEKHVNNRTVPNRSHTKKAKGTWFVTDPVPNKERSGPLAVSRRFMYQVSNPQWVRSSPKNQLGTSTEKAKPNKKTSDKTDGTWFFRRDDLALKRRKSNIRRCFIRKFLSSRGRRKKAGRKNYRWINCQRKVIRFSGHNYKVHQALNRNVVRGDGKVGKSEKRL